MRFLIAIGSEEYSEPTLRIGMQVARGFGASVTIAYVGPKISGFTSHEVQLAHENLERWEFDRPGVEVLGSIGMGFQLFGGTQIHHPKIN